MAKKEPTDAELMAMLRSDAATWKARAQAEATAGAHWRLLAALLLSRVPEKMAEFDVSEVGALRLQGLSIDDFESPDGSYVVRLHKAADEKPPGPTRGEPPATLGS